MIRCASTGPIVTQRVVARHVLSSVVAHMKRGILHVSVAQTVLAAACMGAALALAHGRTRGGGVSLPHLSGEVVEEAPVGEGHRGHDVSPMREPHAVVQASHEEVGETLHMRTRVIIRR